MAEEAPPAKRLARVGSFSGVWWKLGDASATAAGDPVPAAERRLRAIANEEADVRARIQSRQAAGRGVRRRIALASLAMEAVALASAYWRRRRRRMEKKKLLLLLVAVPAALSTVVLAASAGFQKMFDVGDEKKLERLGAERKSKIAHSMSSSSSSSRPGTGSHHNLQNLLQKYDPEAADEEAGAAAAAAKLKRTRSRLSCSFHIGDE